MAELTRRLLDFLNGLGPRDRWDDDVAGAVQWDQQGSRTWDGALFDQVVQQFSVEVTAQVQDTFTFSELLITPTPIVRGISDSFTFSDNLAARIPITRIVSTGSGSFADSAQRDGADFNRQPQDSATFADQITRSIIDAGVGGVQIIAVDEVFPVPTDQIVRLVMRDRAAQDSATFVDSLFPVITNVRTVTVSGGTFSDSVQRDGQDFGRELADALSFSDNLEFITTVPGTVEVNLQDTFVLAENFLTGDKFGRFLQQSVTFAEQIVRHKVAGTLFSEDLGFVEQLLTGDVFGRRIQDAATFSDSLSYNIVQPAALQDSFTFVEQKLDAGYFTRLLQEEFSFAERGNRFAAEGGGDSTTRQIQDTFTFTDRLISEVCGADPWDSVVETDKTWGADEASTDKTWDSVTEAASPWTELVKDEDCEGGVDWTPSGPERKP